MSWQTLEALKERKLDNWLKKGIITKQQYKDIVYHCVEYGFWNALGYATKLKYKNHPELKKKYEYKWIEISKKQCQLREYTTTGSFTNKKRKRFRRWRNIFFNLDGSYRLTKILQENPSWGIFFASHNVYRIGLRREISSKLPECSSPGKAL